MQIIPNLHPIFVHFSVALLPLAAGFFLLSQLTKGASSKQWQTVAWWMLWSGVAISLLTVGSGIYAYNTVNHDTPSHLAMTEHRNWALGTILLYLAVAAWSFIEYRRSQGPTMGFVITTLLAVLVLGSTAWHGGELVYRYGLGVMSLPQASGEGHDHDHGDGHAHDHGDGGKAAAEMNAEADHHDGAADGHDHGDGHGEQAAPHEHAEPTAPHAHADSHHDDGHAH